MLGFSPLGFLPLGFTVLSAPLLALGGTMQVTAVGAGIAVEFGAAGMVAAAREIFTVTPRAGSISIRSLSSGLSVNNA